MLYKVIYTLTAELKLMTVLVLKDMRWHTVAENVVYYFSLQRNAGVLCEILCGHRKTRELRSVLTNCVWSHVNKKKLQSVEQKLLCVWREMGVLLALPSVYYCVTLVLSLNKFPHCVNIYFPWDLQRIWAVSFTS